MLRIFVDGKLCEVSPRVEEMVRQLVEADEEVARHDVGDVALHFANVKVSMRITWSRPAGRVTR